MVMTYKKISIKEITDQLSFAEWDSVKNEINQISGFQKLKTFCKNVYVIWEKDWKKVQKK